MLPIVDPVCFGSSSKKNKVNKVGDGRSFFSTKIRIRLPQLKRNHYPLLPLIKRKDLWKSIPSKMICENLFSDAKYCVSTKKSVVICLIRVIRVLILKNSVTAPR